MNEGQWVQATLRGDKNAFANIVEKHQVAVFNLAYRLLGNATEAEDAAQESFVRAYTRLSTYNLEQSFTTWLLSITAHHCIDTLRKSRRVRTEPVDDLALPAEQASPEKQAVANEQSREVRQALDLLPAHYRLVLVLRYWYDMSYQEIGQVAGLSEGVVKIRLHRARDLLARHVGRTISHAEGSTGKDIQELEGTGNNALFKSRRIDVA